MQYSDKVLYNVNIIQINNGTCKLSFEIGPWAHNIPDHIKNRDGLDTVVERKGPERRRFVVF